MLRPALEDTSSEVGAKRLAEKIEKYWRARGRPVKCGVIRLFSINGGSHEDRGPVYGVVSNLQFTGRPQ